jgi:hypothetical protein
MRSPRDLLTLIDLGARVMTVDGEIDLTTADGEFRAMMLASMARFEVRRKAERQIRANKDAAEKGKPGGHWQPFGYAVDKVSIVPEEAAAIRNGAEMFLGGMTLPAIAKAWNADGFRTNRGNPFDKVAVARRLSLPELPRRSVGSQAGGMGRRAHRRAPLPPRCSYAAPLLGCVEPGPSEG